VLTQTVRLVLFTAAVITDVIEGAGVSAWYSTARILVLLVVTLYVLLYRHGLEPHGLK
jgi:hypothetical protein